VYVDTSNVVVRIPFDGSPATSLSFQALSSMAFDNDNIYFTASDTVDVVPKTGGTPKHLAPAFSGGVAVDDVSVYFSDQRTASLGRILRVPKQGGPVTELAVGQTRPASVAGDGTSVYWNCAEEGTIKKASK